MKTSENVIEIYTAFAKAQASFKVARKESANPFFNSSYADFQSVVEAARPSLAEHGLSFIQAAAFVDGVWILTTRLCHSSGQWFESSYPLNPTKNDPQAFASAQTYGKRHSLQALLGIVTTDDDDGEAAMSHQGEGPGLARKADVLGILKKFEGIGIGKVQIATYLKVPNSEELTQQMLDHLNEIGSGIKSGKIKKEEVFKKVATV